MKIKAGEIWTLSTKILNTNKSKVSPVLIIYTEESDTYCINYSKKQGKSTDNIDYMRISSSIVMENHPYSVSILEWEDAGLDKESFAMCANTYREVKGALYKKIGEVKPKDLKNIVKRHREYQSECIKQLEISNL